LASSQPITTRSGFRKSLTALPSFRNSGLLTTEIGCVVCDCAAAFTLAAVPTGTVDLSTMTFGPFAALPIVCAAAITYFKSAEPSSPDGVPTAMKITSEARTAAGTSVEKVSRPSSTLRFTSGSRPGS
jgi:hypothetical protein